MIPQLIKYLHIYKLKKLKNLELDLTGKEVTAIFGVNGAGKSTILHALACLYRRETGVGETNYFPRFFKRENNQVWAGSRLKADFEVNATPTSRIYSKGRERWTPRVEKRLQRDVVYLGIGSCVPDVEKEPLSRTRFYMGNVPIDVAMATKIQQKASSILGYNYEAFGKYQYAGRKYQNVDVENIGNYSSLSMGAGEQRLFTILEILYMMPPYSMLLIDELDLTLHTRALKRLLDEVVCVAKKKHLQVVFTTHREEIADRQDINVRHIWFNAEADKTDVLSQTTPDCLYRLSGEMQKPLEVFVEDELAEIIAATVVRQMNMLRYVHVCQFGAATNIFVLASGLDMRDEDFTKKMFLLDGDLYVSYDEKLAQVQKVYTGTEEGKDQRREHVAQSIKQFMLPVDEHPEHFLWTKLKESDSEYAITAREVPAVLDEKHLYLNDVAERCGEKREIFLSRIMETLSKMDFWGDYVSELRDWLNEQRPLMGL